MVLSPVISDEQHAQHLLSMVHSDTAKPETLQPNEQVLTPRRARHPISSPVAGELVGARSDIRPPRRGALEYRVLTHQSLLQPSLSPRPAALIRTSGLCSGDHRIHQKGDRDGSASGTAWRAGGVHGGLPGLPGGQGVVAGVGPAPDGAVGGAGA